MTEGRRRPATVRFRVTAAATLAVAVVLVVTALVLVRQQRRTLTESLDEALALEAAELAAVAGTGDAPGTLPAVIDDDGVAQIVAGGEVVASTANLRGRGPIAPPPTGSADVRTLDVFRGESAFRVHSQRTGPDGPVVVHVGAPTDDVADATGALTRSLSVAVPAVVALLGGLVWVLAGRTLAPVEAIRAEVAAIGATDLHRRVPQPATDDEIGRLARTMNGMLDRLEDAARRQQRFVADASHELRSPLTRIRSEIEVDLADPSRADPYATLASVLEEAGELQRLVEDLLHLARADAGKADVTFRPVDLDDVVLRLVRRLRADGRLTVDAGAVSAAQVAGDEAQLARAVANLLDNARRHARTTVVVALAEQDGEAVLSVTDDGPGIPHDQREAVFERFTRVDGARSRDDGGTGLGLAITREIAVRHRGRVAVDPAHRGGARLVLRLPLAQD